MMTRSNPLVVRLTILAAALIGATGVMAAAGASHGDGVRNLGAVAMICLAHGPALLALGLGRSGGRWFATAALLLALGTFVFAGDLLARQYLGQGAFPLAAPLGGLGMIGGWL